MYAISLIGVTPGFSRREFGPEADKIQTLIDACRDMITLGQFDISIPEGGHLYLYGGRRINDCDVRVIGLFEYAQELGGSRSGGYCGAAIWLVDCKIDPSDAFSILQKALEHIENNLLDSNRKFIRTLDALDSTPLDDLISTARVSQQKNASPLIYSSIGERKLVVEVEDRRSAIVEMFIFLEINYDVFENRIIYIVSDSITASAINRLMRLTCRTRGELEKYFAELNTIFHEVRNSHSDDRSNNHNNNSNNHKIRPELIANLQINDSYSSSTFSKIDKYRRRHGSRDEANETYSLKYIFDNIFSDPRRFIIIFSSFVSISIILIFLYIFAFLPVDEDSHDERASLRLNNNGETNSYKDNSSSKLVTNQGINTVQPKEQQSYVDQHSPEKEATDQLRSCFDMSKYTELQKINQAAIDTAKKKLEKAKSKQIPSDLTHEEIDQIMEIIRRYQNYTKCLEPRPAP